MSLSRQFLLVSAVALAAGVYAAGIWLGQRIEASEVRQAAERAALYVESAMAQPLRELSATGRLADETRLALDDIFVKGPLVAKVVRLKLWTPDGTVLYSNDPEQSGRKFTIHNHQALALMGELQASISELDAPDNASERTQWARLLEIYVPLRLPGRKEVVAVAEFYESLDELELDIRADQRQAWVALSLGGLTIFSGLYLLVRRGSQTIHTQQVHLAAQLLEMRALLRDKELLALRLKAAGAKTAELTELQLRRVSADLHDGPAQDLALTLLMLDEASPAALRQRRTNLESCMKALRDIAAGLVVPGMHRLGLATAIRRAVDDAQLKSGRPVVLRCDPALEAANTELPQTSEAVKITAYRVIQEAVANAFRHAEGRTPTVRAAHVDGELVLEISDDGPGFDAQADTSPGHLGLAFMRERVQVLGGRLDVHAEPGLGTRVVAFLPLAAENGAA